MKAKQSEQGHGLPSLWPDGSPLKLVNQDKFDPTITMQKTGLTGFTPTSDGNVVRQRQDSLKLLIGSEDLRSLINTTSLEPRMVYDKNFFTRYGSQSDFIEKCDNLEKVLADALKQNQHQLSTGVHRDFVEAFSKGLARAKQAEDTITERLMPELEKIYSYTGTVHLTTEMVKDKECTKIVTDGYGYRDYAFHESNSGIIKLSRVIIDWYEEEVNPKKWWEHVLNVVVTILTFIPYFLSTLVMSYVEKNRNDVLYTEDVPPTITKEITRLHKQFVQLVQEKFNSALSDLNISFDEGKANKAVKTLTEFQFTLKPEAGFKVRLVNASVKMDMEKFKYSGTVDFGSIRSEMQQDTFLSGMSFKEGVSWYSRAMFAIVENRARKQAIRAAEKALLLPLNIAYERAVVESQELLLLGKNTMTTETYESLMNEVKYVNIHNAISGLGLDQEWGKVTTFRDLASKALADLKKVCHIAESVIVAREKFENLPFCFPTVLDNDKNMVVFDNLAPIHLIDRKDKDGTKDITAKDLRLITGLPALNGKIVSITGQNGGGKTATEVELINALYQAHTGLPVFAKNFSFNAKEVIAMVFVERGEGSMLQLLMKKLTVIAEEIDRNPSNRVVIIIDELLTGTQEDAGEDIGKKYLDMLARKGCSVMFVTQITKLAQYAQDRLGALSFYFDSKGGLRPGIGKGNAHKLAEEVGLSKYL